MTLIEINPNGGRMDANERGSYFDVSMGGQLHGVTSGRLARILGVEVEELHEPHNGMMGRYIISTCDGAWVQNQARDSLWRFIAREPSP